MTQPLDGAILAVAEVIRNVSGIRQVLNYPTDTVNVFPVAVVYSQSGNYTVAPVGTKKGLHNITIDVLLPAQQGRLENRLQTLIALVDPIAAALVGEVSPGGDRFGNVISTFDRVSYSFLPAIDYDANPLQGYRFVMEGVKILAVL